MTSTPSPEDRAELIRALGVLAEGPGPTPLCEALGLPSPVDPADHTQVFVLELRPYASLYLGPEGMLGGEARDRVAGFWRALGLVPPPEPDHLAALFGLLADLTSAAAAEPDPARRELSANARSALVHEHLASWLGPYLARVGDLGSPPLRRWADLVETVIAEEPVRPGLPAQLADAPTLPQEGVESIARFLLTPARSGLLVTPSDLQACAAGLGLGLRMGDRAFALRVLFEQDLPQVAGWLARLAGAWEERHATLALGPTRAWSDRAAASRRLLSRLASP